MKLSTLATFSSLSLGLAAVLDTRQECSEDDCYRAIWGNGGLPRIIQAGQDCEDFLTTSVIWNPMLIAHSTCQSTALTVYCSITITVLTRTTSTTTTSCPTTASPITTIETPLPTTSEENRLWIRQAQPTDWSTTTEFGPVPPYATQACASQAYKSACGCASITENTVTYLGTVSFASVCAE
jgi:hypothetical protein